MFVRGAPITLLGPRVPATVTGVTLLSNELFELMQGQSLNTDRILGFMALSQGSGVLGTVRAGRDLRGLPDDPLGELGQERARGCPSHPGPQILPAPYQWGVHCSAFCPRKHGPPQRGPQARHGRPSKRPGGKSTGPLSPGDPPSAQVNLLFPFFRELPCGMTQSPGQEAFHLPRTTWAAASEHVKALPDMI